MNISKTIADALPISASNTRLKLENYMDEKNDQAILNHLKKEVLNDVKQQFFNEKDKVNLELVKSLKEQIDILKNEIYFLHEEMKEKNNLLKMLFHSPKTSPQEIALSSSTSKDIIKDHHKNLTLHTFAEIPNSFAGSSKRSEKDNRIIFQEIKATPGARQTISPITSRNKKIPATKTDQSTAQTKSRKNNNSNNHHHHNNKLILYNRTQKKNHQMMQ